MSRARILLFVLASLIFLPLAAQKPESGITDKNYHEQYAAYVLRGAYSEYGYLGAQIAISSDGGKTSYTVDPGPVYHLAGIKVMGVESSLMSKVMEGAPAPGDVYNALKVNDWIAHVPKRGLPLRMQRQSAQIDRQRAQVSVTVEFAKTE